MNYNYSPYQNYGMYQQPNYQAQQQPIVQTQQTNNSPFNDLRFATIEEAKAYIMLPNTKVMFMDRDNSIFYIKSADTLGKSTLEGYKYTRIENNPTESVSHEIDTKNFVKMEDLKDFITKEDLKNFITRDELNNLFRRDINDGKSTN